MKIGIIGSGRIGKAVTKHLSKAGHQVVMSNKSGPSSLSKIVHEFGTNVKAGTVEEATKVDMVLLSIPWTEVSTVLSAVKQWTGQIILDATNAASFPGFKPLDLGGKASSQVVAELAPGAHVVKVFNTVEAATLASDPYESGGKRVVFISGDDDSAKKTVLDLLDKLGFAGIDLGSLAASKIQQVGGPLITKNFILLSN